MRTSIVGLLALGVLLAACEDEPDGIIPLGAGGSSNAGSSATGGKSAAAGKSGAAGSSGAHATGGAGGSAGSGTAGTSAAGGSNAGTSAAGGHPTMGGSGGIAAGGGGATSTGGNGGSSAGPGGAAGTSAEGGSSGQGGAGGDTSALAPNILSSSFTQSPTAPLAGVLLVALDRPGKLKIALQDGQGHLLELASTGSTTVHTLPLLQLRPSRTYAYSIVAIDDAGHESAPSVGFRVTPSLPVDFPHFDVVAATSTTTELTLFPVGRWAPGAPGVDNTWAYLVAVDSTGEVVWFAQANTSVSDLRVTAAGELRYVLGNNVAIIDSSVLGEPQRGFFATGLNPPPSTIPSGAIQVKTDTLHHDAIELPNGHILALSSTAKMLTPTDCPNYDKPYNVVGDLVVEIDPTTGEVISSVSMFDLLDPCRRVDTAFKSAFWAPQYGASSADWIHGNGLVYDKNLNAVLVSSRHQDWVIAYRYADDAGGKAGSILFKFGAEGDFTLKGTGDFPYHQHAPKVLSNGHLMVFDNGTTRPGTSDTDITKLPASRGAEFSLDMSGAKGTWSASQVWEYGASEVRFVDNSTGSPVNVPYYSSVIGNAEPTKDGTVLLTEGALTEPATGALFDPTVRKSTRIFEVTQDAAQKVVLDLRARDPGANSFSGYITFRAVRIPTLYPANGGVTATIVKH